MEDPEHKNVAVKIVRQYREDIFIREVARLRQAEADMHKCGSEFFAENRRELQRIVSRIVED